MKNILIYLTSVYTFTCFQCTPQDNGTFTEKYDLDFKAKSNAWEQDFNYPFRIRLDSLLTEGDKTPVCFTPIETLGVAIPIAGAVYQQIFLPEAIRDSIQVSLRCKSVQLKEAYLIAAVLDGEKRLLSRDTVSILGPEEWETFSSTLSGTGGRFLDLSIVARGHFINDASGQRLCLDRMQIMVGNKNIDQFPLPSVSVLPKINKDEMVELSFGNDQTFADIPSVLEPKILAIGESSHGNKTMSAVAAQLIRYQVAYNNTNLVLLELPLENTLSLNRYIQGDSRFRLEDIPDLHLAGYLFEYQELKELLDWLKAYNRSVEEKVWLLGMDIPLDFKKSSSAVINYLNTIKGNENLYLIDTLMYMASNWDTFEEAPTFMLQNKPILQEILGYEEYGILSRYFKNLIKANLEANNLRVPLYHVRDRFMYQNTKFLSDLLCSGANRAVLYAHLGHVGYTHHKYEGLFPPTTGYHLKKKYGKDYYTLGILAGEGSIRVWDRDSLVVRALHKPEPNSIEYALQESGLQYGFVPTSALTAEYAEIRHTGNSYAENQYYMISPGRTMDGIIFIRDSEPHDIVPGTPVTQQELSLYNLEKRGVDIKKIMELQ